MLRIVIISVALALALCGCSKKDEREMNKAKESAAKAVDSASPRGASTVRRQAMTRRSHPFNPASSDPASLYASAQMQSTLILSTVRSVASALSRHCSKQGPDARRQRHGQCAPERDAYCTHRHPCTTHACG